MKDTQNGIFKKPQKTSHKHVLREEHFQSRHLAEIIYAYQQIVEALEREESELGIHLDPVSQVSALDLIPSPLAMQKQGSSKITQIRSQPALIKPMSQTMKKQPSTKQMMAQRKKGGLDYEEGSSSSGEDSDDSL